MKRIARPLSFLAGVAVGYVAGSAAGRERYEAIAARAAKFASAVGLPDLGERVTARGTDVAQAATRAAGEFVDVAADKATGAAP